MNPNWLLVPTLALGLVLFVAGRRWAESCRTFKSRVLFLCTALVGSIPGLLFALYYAHLFDNAIWFYEFRSLPLIELSAGVAGLLAGGVARFSKGRVSQPFFALLLCGGLLMPHMKPIVAPRNASEFLDHWADGVCLQSTEASCGAASAATVFKQYGFKMTEADVATECYTYRGGTENWYLARAFRKRGLLVEYRSANGLPENLRTPAIAGVRLESCGHFIPILTHSNGVWVTGDPLVGRRTYSSKAELEKEYRFTGFFMEIGKPAD